MRILVIPTEGDAGLEPDCVSGSCRSRRAPVDSVVLAVYWHARSIG
jgi:hypothetical protein